MGFIEEMRKRAFERERERARQAKLHSIPSPAPSPSKEIQERLWESARLHLRQTQFPRFCEEMRQIEQGRNDTFVVYDHGTVKSEYGLITLSEVKLTSNSVGLVYILPEEEDKGSIVKKYFVIECRTNKTIHIHGGFLGSSELSQHDLQSKDLQERVFEKAYKHPKSRRYPKTEGGATYNSLGGYT